MTPVVPSPLEGATSGDGPGHRLSAGQVRDLWSLPAGARVPLPGERECELVLDPADGRMRVYLPYDGRVPAVGRLRHVRVLARVWAGEEILEVGIGGVGPDPVPAYEVLMHAVDLVQVSGLSSGEAVESALLRFRRLFEAEDGLSLERELGLYGELLILEHLSSRLGAEQAVAAWIGPMGEEHDFAGPGSRIEVKTTSTERRSHLVHGVGQLTGAAGVPLFVLSVQVTDAGRQGRTLRQLVESVERRCASVRAPLSARLAQIGRLDRAGSEPSRSWVLRSPVAAYLVDDDFPRITQDALTTSVPQSGRIDDLVYRVDLSGLRESLPPAPFDRLHEIRPE